MEKLYFKSTFALYYIALLVGMACRIVLKLRYMAVDTGFYTVPTMWETTLNVTLAVCLVLLLLSNRLRRAHHDYPVWRHSRGVDLVGLFTGIAILAFLFTDYLSQLFAVPGDEIPFRISTVLISIFGVLAGISFIALGIRGRNAVPEDYTAIFACIWQAIMVVTRFNSYTTLTAIPDNLLTVLFMLFASLFLLGHARTIVGIGRHDGRNYAIPAGLCMSLCGLLLVIPNYVALPLHGFLPAPMLGYTESAYILLLSVYGFLFARSVVKSIGTV